MQRHLPSLIALAMIGLIVFGYGIGKRDLWAPDEPRFGLAAREMLQRLHSPDPAIRKSAPFVLHVNNEAYSDKPPLYVWLVAAINGGDGSSISNGVVRMPSVAAGILGLWIIYAFALALFQKRRIALLSAIILATTLMYAWQAARAQLDMLMSMWSYLAMLCFWMAHTSKKRGGRLGWFAAFWAAGALGTLSKGPPAIIIPLGTAAFFLAWQISARKALWTAVAWSGTIFILTILAKMSFAQSGAFMPVLLLALIALLLYTVATWTNFPTRRTTGRLIARIIFFLLGLALCAAIIGIWFIPYKMYGPHAAVSDTLISQNLTRYFAAEQHQGSVIYFFVNLPHNLLPWTLFVFAAIYYAWKGASPMPQEPRRLLMTWILFTYVFFSLSPGKRDQYVLPAIPAFALFCGWFFDLALLSAKDSSLFRWIKAGGYVNAIIALVGAVALIGTGIAFNAPGNELTGWRGHLADSYDASMVDLTHAGFLWAGIIAAIVGVVLFVSASRRRVWGVLVGSAILMGGISLYLNGWVYPPINPRKSGRIISEQIIKARAQKDTPVAGYDLFREEYVLYGDYFLQRIKEGMDNGDPKLRQFLAQPHQAFVLMRSSSLKKLKKAYPNWPIRLRFEQGIGRRSVAIIDNGRS